MEYDIVIVGAGVMGAATAFYLSKYGKKILLLDQFRVKNTLNSSQDYSRVFRYEYGDDEFYTNLAVESLKLWKEFERETGRQFYFQCGELLIAESKENYALKCYKTLKKLDHPVDLLDEKDLKKRFPQFSAKLGVLDHHGGVLEASSVVESFVERAKKNGVLILENAKVIRIENDTVFLDGKNIKFKKLVVTCGVWTSKLIDVPITITKQQLVYFKPKNIQNFTKDKFPLFGYLDKGFYGFPIHGIDAVKVSNHLPGKVVDPDEDDRKVSEDFIESCKSFFRKFIPDLADTEVVKTKVCFYSMTSDEDFIIDKLNDRVIIGAGFSGHGFKFAPLIGKILSDLAISGETQYDISRFRMNRF
ncbi:MAG: N-methyl-L-tryptophan oxidase [Nanoarchaeota archaeon]|nr:N-methyl-L-tryptophan oxidase [Nanoarchaeota archaeon]